MKQFLIDRGRTRAIRHRLDPQIHSSLPTVCLPPDFSSLAARHALSRLERVDPLAAETIRLIYWQGQTLAEVAAIQGRPSWKVHEDSEFAVHWVAQELR